MGCSQGSPSECIEAYPSRDTEPGWFLCPDSSQIICSLGAIENDFHGRRDLTPNICAIYTKESHRRLGIAGKLLNMAAVDLITKGLLQSLQQALYHSCMIFGSRLSLRLRRRRRAGR